MKNKTGDNNIQKIYDNTRTKQDKTHKRTNKNKK